MLLVSLFVCYNAAMIIDFHTHIFPPEIVHNREKYLETDPLFALLYANPKARLATAEDLLSNMDEQGIDISVTQNIAWNTPEMCRRTNDYIIESIKHYPQRLIGFGMVVLDSPSSALPEIERCAENGIRGMGEIRPDRRLLAGPLKIRPVMESLIEHDMILSTHTTEPVGHIYTGKGEATPELLYPLFSSYPSLKIVCAHWGGGMPFYFLMPEVRRALDRVYFDSAASPFLYSSRVYLQAASMAGEERILFGSDYPLLKPGRLLSEINTLDLPQDLKNKILSENARKVLDL
ncbi:MAG: amidohydrolase [Dehalococcoidales bacterium]|nr:amidohydrolase [Dehalococcoidales bacterium]